jgi:acetyl esterase
VLNDSWMNASLPVRMRRKATMFAVDRFFYGLAALGALHPLARPERHDLVRTRDILYGDEAVHRLDVWRPEKGPVKGAVFYVHGGGFRILSKDTHWVMALMFARAGYVVFNVDYRLAPAHPYPAAISDVARAYAWVVDHAREYGADPKRIVLAGESAGGNLVTALTVATCFDRSEPWARDVFVRGVVPAAVLPACGLLQVTEPERFRSRWPHMSGARASRRSLRAPPLSRRAPRVPRRRAHAQRAPLLARHVPLPGKDGERLSCFTVLKRSAVGGLDTLRS